MDIKLKSYSHSLGTKITVFIIAIACLMGGFASFLTIVVAGVESVHVVIEDSYFQSIKYMEESNDILRSLDRLLNQYKNEEAVLNGEARTEEEIYQQEDWLFQQYQNISFTYDHSMSYQENFQRFKEQNPERISQLREKLLREDLKEYNRLLKVLGEYKGMLYYATDGENVYTNSTTETRDYFATFPSYFLIDEQDNIVYPQEVGTNKRFYMISQYIYDTNETTNTVYVAFSEEFLNPRIKDWENDRVIARNALLKIGGLMLVFLVAFIYLCIIIGRRHFDDKALHLNPFDRLYNDIKLFLGLVLSLIWYGIAESISFNDIFVVMLPVTTIISVLGLMLLLSLVKQLKNKSLLSNTLIYRFFYNIFKFLKDVYNSGSTGIKLVLIIIGYPAILAITFFIFPITMAAAAWLTLKRVKEFNKIKEGVELIKNGELHHKIEVKGDGEFGRLAANINTIAEGLHKAVDSELKSERLKTELITNVSHDIRTPLTSIITYVDLLKQEGDPEKLKEYIEILEQKSQRLRLLTDDLFEAAKATSGNIPVNIDKIDMVSLITQGLGELNDKVEEHQLEFKINQPADRVYIAADGRLFWRAVENLFSNIFKYALKGSRVYLSIEDLGNEVSLVIKNISAYELNISADELMERFKRGEESRSSQGSGLGLSIAKSLIDIQRGHFSIEIDGDLFKAIIQMPKYRE